MQKTLNLNLKEVFKKVKGFDGYEVSNLGRVRHFHKRWKKYVFLKPIVMRNRLLTSKVVP